MCLELFTANSAYRSNLHSLPCIAFTSVRDIAICKTLCLVLKKTYPIVTRLGSGG